MLPYYFHRRYCLRAPLPHTYANMDEDLEEEATPPRLTAAQNSRQESPLLGKRSPEEDAEEDAATPPPPKRKKFFAKEDSSDDVAIVVKNEVVEQAAANSKKSKAPVVVELLDDESDGDEPVASTSKASPRPATPPKPRVPRNGKDFKVERYFGSQYCIFADPGTRPLITMCSFHDGFLGNDKLYQGCFQDVQEGHHRETCSVCCDSEKTRNCLYKHQGEGCQCYRSLSEQQRHGNRSNRSEECYVSLR